MPYWTQNLLSALACLQISTALATDAQQEVRFVGNLSRTVGDEQIVLRDFEVLLLQGRHSGFFSILDNEKEGCPWPESFGLIDNNTGPRPHLIYGHADSTYTLPLPALKLNIPDSAAVGSQWDQNGWSFQIADRSEKDGQEQWKVKGEERRGRRLQATVNSSGVLQSATMDVFMGQGDKFQLNIEQSSTATVAPDTLKRVESTIDSLIDLQAALGRRADSQLAELSPRQAKLASQAMDSLSQQAKDTPLQETVLRIRRDVTRQQRRITQAMERQQQLINSDAPKFSLNLISGKTLESSAVVGKTVVLHFWAYSDKPLTEPYGQVGYLEYLFNQRKPDNVTVIGIATNPGLQVEDQSRTAKRSARKLAEFMNLSYPIGYDNGTLIRSLGDPRESGGELPLWVVISPEGKVAHYQAGFYEVDSRAGLKKLNAVLDALK